MRKTSKIIFLTFLLIGSAIPLFSQQSLVRFYNTQLRSGLDNIFYVVIQEEKPVQLNQIKVFFYDMWEKEKLEVEERGSTLKLFVLVRIMK